MNESQIALFSLDTGRLFLERVSSTLSVPIAPHEERGFEDGEHKCRPLASVRNRGVFVVQSLYSDDHESVNDKLCRLLFFLGALRDASAGRVTAVVPYLCYARKDSKSKRRDPVTTRYVAAMFEAVGVDRIVTMDVHNLAAYQNAFRCYADHLEARPLFVEHFAGLLQGQDAVVVSPDAGGVKRAEAFRRSLEHTLRRPIPLAFMEKQRSEGVVSGEAIVGPVSDRVAVIIDDMVSTGTTLARAARACRQRGATTVYAAATHGLFVGGANEAIGDPALDRLVITDTVPPFRLERALVNTKVTVLPASSLIAESIRRIHEGGSLVELLA